MPTMDRRRRLAVLAGGLAAIAGGLSGLLGQHGVSSISNRYLLDGVSVGVTVGVLILLLVRMKAAGND
ncbi:MAG: hypothetical protein NVSMB6_28570 [Burkholderiaceae bacterium]